jgi:hypothetical protein
MRLRGDVLEYVEAAEYELNAMPAETIRGVCVGGVVTGRRMGKVKGSLVAEDTVPQLTVYLAWISAGKPEAVVICSGSRASIMTSSVADRIMSGPVRASPFTL